MASPISQSVGKGGVNRPDDVKTVQQLLNAHIRQLTPLAPLVEDGKCGRHTIHAIEEFQRRVVMIYQTDGRVEPGGQTYRALSLGVFTTTTAPPESTGSFRIVFEHGVTEPEPTSATKGTARLYESKVTMTGPRTGTFRGSIYPDDLSQRGRLKDGTYDLYLGFHKREGHQPTAADLKVRDNGFRPALIVNADKPVPVISNKPGKTTSEFIHVHNGYNSKRFSDGCPTLSPGDWPGFIKLFLETYPALATWMETNKYVGKKIGLLEVKT